MSLPEIDDNNFQNFMIPVVDGERKGRGWYGMYAPNEPRMAGTFQDLGVPLIPENEWDERIRQLQTDHATQREFYLEMGLTVLDQAQTNYCWINAPTFCCMANRLMESGQCLRFSPASAGARIKGFKNVGGWGNDGLKWMRQNGVNQQTDWPPNAINRQYDTPENREKAKKNIVLEYFVLESWEQSASCILSGIPIAVGFNWWSHEVTGVGITIGEHNLEIANSWGTKWGENGYGLLKGQKKIPDDSVAITSMVAT